MTLTFGSLFAGVGGFDLGFESAGYECRFQVEWDSHCQQTLAHHWPDVPRWGDVSTVNGADLPPVDVITYGFPCQDLSVAGKRAGLDGQRSHLFFEAVRIITEMREATNGRYPTWAVAENVAGLLNADGGSAMARVVDELAAAGAVVIEWATLDAQWFGVPQRRRRVFIASCFNPATGDRCPDPLFPVGKSSSRNPETSDSPRQKAATDTGTGAESGGCNPDINRMTFIPFRQLGFGHYTDGGQGSAVKARDYKDSTDLVAFVKVVRSGARDEDGNLPPEVWREEHTNPTLTQFDQGDTRTTTAVVQPMPTHDVVGTLQNRFPGTNHGGIRDGQLIPMVAQPRVIAPTLTATNDPSRSPQSSEITQQVAAVVEAQIQPIGFRSTGGSLGADAHENLSPTLTVGSGIGIPSPPAVAQPIAFSAGNSQKARSIAITENGTPPLRAGASGTNQTPTVMTPELAVRRLTPVECERLMGWPDNHTLHRADGKTNADSTRYKQCGNGVASPVAAWIARHLANTLTQ